MGADKHQWYFDLGETSTEAENPDEIFSHSTKVATREDIEDGRSDTPFDFMNEEIEGLDNFTQSIVDQFVNKTTKTPEEAIENLDEIEGEIIQEAREKVDVVHSVTASQSDRYDDEIEVSMTVEDEGSQHETSFYLGSRENIDSLE